MRIFMGGVATVLLAAVVEVLVMAADSDSNKRVGIFEGKDTLLLPKDYREWIFVGSSLGLRYDEKDDRQRSEELDYKNVYIDPGAYREYSKTGQFPQGTILVLEIATAETKKEPGLRGSFQKEFVGLLAAVKDRDRFKEEWAYFRFTDKSGKLTDKARPFPKNACYDCHHENAADDNVFTQFYPVLRKLSPK
jgi:Cytochrome P460